MDIKKDIKNNTVYVDRWLYHKPQFMPNQDGNIILISKGCFGPVEVYEWGIDANKHAYERYNWLENDFYTYENYCITIEREQLLQQIQDVILLFKNNDLPEWAEMSETILDKFNRETEWIS
ncbi:MAG: hypothetical protein K2L86_06225 [Lachnospiraceae bacterium]|nr:hypothetical protein [Lachnospiraceae bacterium]